MDKGLLKSHALAILAGLAAAIFIACNSPSPTMAKGDRREGGTQNGAVTPQESTSASTSERSQEKNTESTQEDNTYPAGSVAGHPLAEIVIWEEARDWWPHGSLLRAASPPADHVEEIVAESQTGGTSGDPKVEEAGLTVFYARREASPRTEDLVTVIEGGAFIVRVSYWPGNLVPYSDPRWSDRKVMVRGRLADLKELNKSNSNVNWRAIRWNDSSSQGTIQWEFSSHPIKHTEEEALDFIERLEEVGCEWC